MYKILYSREVYNVDYLILANGRHGNLPGREARAFCVSVAPRSMTPVANR
jgi:hypothetical protein